MIHFPESLYTTNCHEGMVSEISSQEHVLRRDTPLRLAPAAYMVFLPVTVDGHDGKLALEEMSPYPLGSACMPPLAYADDRSWIRKLPENILDFGDRVIALGHK